MTTTTTTEIREAIRQLVEHWIHQQNARPGADTSPETDLHRSVTRLREWLEAPIALQVAGAVREVVIRYAASRRRPEQFTGSTDVAVFARRVLKDNSREHLIALYLDSGNRLAGYSLVSIGTANSTTVHPREVFQPAIAIGAVSLLLIHNHPGGSTQPSEEDRSVTRRIREAGQLLGVKLLDHVIVTDTDHFSFNDSGEL